MAKAAIIVGIVLLLLSLAVLVISLILPIASDGRTSWEEAAPAIGGGVCCSVMSGAVLLVGIVMLMMNKKNAPTPGATTRPGMHDEM
jgi:cytochrome b561